MDLPDWLARAVEAVLRDMRDPTPLALDATYAPGERSDHWGTLRFTSPAGETFAMEVPSPDEGSETDLLFRLAEELPWYVAELEQSWAQSRPACPGHTHPAAPLERDGLAWWSCPRDGTILGQIGAPGDDEPV